MRLLLFLLAGCATTPKVPAGPGCELELNLLSTPFVGRVSGGPERPDVMGDARAAACAALHASAPQLSCKDTSRVVETSRLETRFEGGEVVQQAEVTLRRIEREQHRAGGDSPELCRKQLESLCASRKDGSTCDLEGVECKRVGSSIRCGRAQ